MRWAVRLAWILAGGGWFLWLPFEDQSLRPVMLVGAGLAFALGITLLARWAARRSLSPLSWAAGALLAGGLAGGAAAPLAVVSIFAKVSLHGHPVPDFSAADLAVVIGRTPIWGLIGLLAGAALALAWRPGNLGFEET